MFYFQAFQTDVCHQHRPACLNTSVHYLYIIMFMIIKPQRDSRHIQLQKNTQSFTSTPPSILLLPPLSPPLQPTPSPKRTLAKVLVGAEGQRCQQKSGYLCWFQQRADERAPCKRPGAREEWDGRGVQTLCCFMQCAPHCGAPSAQTPSHEQIEFMWHGSLSLRPWRHSALSLFHMMEHTRRHGSKEPGWALWIKSKSTYRGQHEAEGGQTPSTDAQPDDLILESAAAAALSFSASITSNGSPKCKYFHISACSGCQEPPLALTMFRRVNLRRRRSESCWEKRQMQNVNIPPKKTGIFQEEDQQFAAQTDLNARLCFVSMCVHIFNKQRRERLLQTSITLKAPPLLTEFTIKLCDKTLWMNFDMNPISIQKRLSPLDWRRLQAVKDESQSSQWGKQNLLTCLLIKKTHQHAATKEPNIQRVTQASFEWFRPFS